ncbi:MAG: SEC-C domain-containing protein, partial [Clostridiales bacterium]|nr:SEC-C domain-containing protein [Clostridiales bacterium]
KWDYQTAIDKISQKTAKCYEEKIENIQAQAPIDFSDVERRFLLRVVDSNWIDHIDAMDQLRKGIGLRAYGQTDPVISYKQEGFAMFDEMVERIQERTIAMLLKVQLQVQERPIQRVMPSANTSDAAQEQAQAPEQKLPAAVNVDALKTNGSEKFNPASMKKDKKPGPNDPCPCGSGLKYKKCHGKV